MNKIQFLLLILITMFLFSCGNTSEPSKNMQIFPLNKGNIWIYQDYVVKDKDSLIKYGNDSIIVLGDTTVDNFRFYNLNYFSSIFSIAYLNDSLFAFVDPRNTYSKPYFVYSYPCKTGDFYMSAFGICIVENIDTTITVQAGKFRCIKYKFYAMNEIGVGFNDYHYCSPGIGLIKIEQYRNSYSQNDVFNKEYETELIRYNIKD